MLCITSSAPQNENQRTNLRLSEVWPDANCGEAEAFERACEALRPRLLNIAQRITRNREDAEDAVQDALMSAYLHIDNFQHNSAFSTWLTRIVMNSALMINRRNRTARQVSTEDLNRGGELELDCQIPDRTPDPEQIYLQSERTRILGSTIRKLRPRVRAVVEIALFQDLPLKETAKILDISVTAVKSRLLQARATLRKSLALRAIARTRREPRHEFAHFVYRTSSFCGCIPRPATDFSLVAGRVSGRGYGRTNLHAATVTFASVNVSKAFYHGAHQISLGSNSWDRRKGLERNRRLQIHSGSDSSHLGWQREKLR
jgi:RNA polymerase sigma-70 factor (ECF subfamily)